MKQWIPMILAALLLAGCATQPIPTEPTAPPTAAPTVPTEASPTEPEPTEPPLPYLQLKNSYRAVVPMGNHLILFRTGGTVRFDPETGEIPAASVKALPLPDSGLTRVLENEIVYFDTEAKTLITLNEDFKETGRKLLEDDILGDPVLTLEGTGLYYCVSTGIRHWDSETGISRDLKLHQGDWQGIEGMTREGTWLKAVLANPDGSLRQLLISTENGQTVAEGELIPYITATGDFYCCPTGEEWIFGVMGQQPQLLLADAIPLTEIRCALELTQEPDGLRLDLYDLTTGKRIASSCFEGISQAGGFLVQGGSLLFLADDRLYSWEWSGLEEPDDRQYTCYRYTEDAPDVEGLAALKARADDLENRFGIEIELWQEVVGQAPAGFAYKAQWRTEVIEAALNTLETALNKFPAGFMERAAAWTGSGKLRIYLTAGIETPHEGVYAQVERMQYLAEKDAFIALVMNEDLERNFYHTLAHVFDTMVLSHSAHFFEWHLVTPGGFKYDGDYGKNLDRTENKYPQYFIDTFSMSFPVEDRATIFEYAMTEGNEAVFEQKYIQQKLSRLCKGLRQVFGLEEESYPWEQYWKK